MRKVSSEVIHRQLTNKLRTKQKPISLKKGLCVGGPFHNFYIVLSTQGDGKSMIFKLRGYQGYYKSYFRQQQNKSHSNYYHWKGKSPSDY